MSLIRALIAGMTAPARRAVAARQRWGVILLTLARLGSERTLERRLAIR